MFVVSSSLWHTSVRQSIQQKGSKCSGTIQATMYELNVEIEEDQEKQDDEGEEEKQKDE